MKKILFILTIILSFSFISVNAQSCYKYTSPMSVGSKDSTTNGEVSKLQAYLYDLGYLNVKPTGYFGELTKAAVIKYQQSRGIDPVGSAGPITRLSLSNECNTANNNNNNNNNYYAGNYNLSNNKDVLNNASNQTGTQSQVQVTFYSLDENVTLKVPLGSILNLPSLPTRSKFSSYVFVGWYVDQSYTTAYSNQPIVNNTNLYAKWVKNCSTNGVVYPNDCDSTNIASSTANKTEVVSTKVCIINGISITVASNINCDTLKTNANNMATSTATSTANKDNSNNSGGIYKYPNSNVTGVIKYCIIYRNINKYAPVGNAKGQTYAYKLPQVIAYVDLGGMDCAEGVSFNYIDKAFVKVEPYTQSKVYKCSINNNNILPYYTSIETGCREILDDIAGVPNWKATEKIVDVSETTSFFNEDKENNIPSAGLPPVWYNDENHYKDVLNWPGVKKCTAGIWTIKWPSNLDCPIGYDVRNNLPGGATNENNGMSHIYSDMNEKSTEKKLLDDGIVNIVKNGEYPFTYHGVALETEMVKYTARYCIWGNILYYAKIDREYSSKCPKPDSTNNWTINFQKDLFPKYYGKLYNGDSIDYWRNPIKIEKANPIPLEDKYLPIEIFYNTTTELNFSKYSLDGYYFDGVYSDFTYKNLVSDTKIVAPDGVNNLINYVKWSKVCPNGKKIIWPNTCNYVEKNSHYGIYAVNDSNINGSMIPLMMWNIQNPISDNWLKQANRIPHEFAGAFSDKEYKNKIALSGATYLTSDMYLKWTLNCSDGSTVVYPDYCPANTKIATSTYTINFNYRSKGENRKVLIPTNAPLTLSIDMPKDEFVSHKTRAWLVNLDKQKKFIGDKSPKGYVIDKWSYESVSMTTDGFNPKITKIDVKISENYEPGKYVIMFCTPEQPVACLDYNEKDGVSDVFELVTSLSGVGSGQQGSVLGVSTYQFSDELKKGDKGEEVLKLQKILISFGENIEATGYFGKKTKEALKRFQENHKEDILKPIKLKEGTGYFGTSTRKYLNNLFINIVTVD